MKRFLVLIAFFIGFESLAAIEELNWDHYKEPGRAASRRIRYNLIEEVTESGESVIYLQLRHIGAHFATDSDRLGLRSRKKIGRLGFLLSMFPEEWDSLSINGHSDIRGSKAYNMDLSARRAKSVGRLLLLEGIEEERIEAKGYGPLRPLDPANTRLAWAKNRRVEIRLYGVEKGSPFANKLVDLLTN